MKLIYISSYSLVYPEVFKTLAKNFQIDSIDFYKKGLSPDTTDKKLIFYRQQVDLNVKLANPSISINFFEIAREQDLVDPGKFRDYINSLISNKYSSLPKETIFFVETLAINHMKWKLETPSNSHTFILFTYKHKKNLDLSLGGQNWKRIHMESPEPENSLIDALKKARKEESSSRFEHTLRVLEFANQISNWCSLDESTRSKLLLSCAYHDFAKDWSKTKLLNYATKIYSKPKKELETELWSLHGPVAKYHLSRTFRLDQDVLDAIEYHTKPISNLNKVGKLLVIADKLEPRKKDSYSPQQYEILISWIQEGKIDEVFKYLLDNPIKS